MHDLPPQLSRKIWELLESIDATKEDKQILYEGFANIMVRSNRIMQKQLSQLIASFKFHAESGEFSEHAKAAALTAIESIKFIHKEIVRPAVHPRAKDKVEDIIQRFWESQDEDRGEV